MPNQVQTKPHQSTKSWYGMVEEIAADKKDIDALNKGIVDLTHALAGLRDKKRK